MSMGHPRQPSLLAMPGLLLAVLALVSQLALGSVVLPNATAGQSLDTALDTLTILCSADAPPVDGHRPPVHRHAPEQALCPMRVAAALHAVVLAAPPPIPLPPSQRTGPAVAASRARSPPQSSGTHALPRGPPLLA